MKTQLYIPKKIKVGFQSRSDTYTKRLGYIIYNDGKVWRKETSWLSWMDKKIPAMKLDNVPTEGFVLNKEAGGRGGSSSSWNTRQTYSRVFDPRGFEFEITIPNLLFILQETNSIKGKGLEGEFVYSWDGKDLVLLPAGCHDYKKCMEFTEVQLGKLSAKDLVEGGIYKSKKEKSLIYLGKHNCYGDLLYGANSWRFNMKVSNEYVFTDGNGRFFNMSSLSNMSSTVDKTPVSNYAALMEQLQTQILCGQILDLNESILNIPFSENQKDRYRNSMKGEHYRSHRTPDMNLEQKLDITLYKKISDDVYQVFRMTRLIEEVDKDLTQMQKDSTEDWVAHYKKNYFCWKHRGYKLSSSKIIKFENGELSSKSTTYTDDRIYSKDEIDKMCFIGLTAKLRNDKNYNIL